MKKIVSGGVPLLFTLSFAMSQVSQAQSITLNPSNVTEVSIIKKAGIGFSHESPNGLIKLGTYVSNTGAYIQTHTNHPLNFGTNDGLAQMTLATNGFLGIGNTAPENTLQIGATIAPFAGNHIAIGASTGGGMSFNQTGAATSGASIWYSNANFALMPVGAGTGRVGIGNLAPANKLQIGPNNAFSSNDIAIGNAAGGGMSFLQSGAEVTGSSIWYSNSNLSVMPAGAGAGNLGIGITLPTAKLHVDGYTKLGNNNTPAIAMAKFTGTTAGAQGGNTPIVHGLTASKILSISVVVDLGGAGNVFENYTQSAGYQVGTSFEATNIYIWNSPTNSANILNKPFKVLVTYEQ